MNYVSIFIFLAWALSETAHAAEIGWPEAVSRLAGERSRAEICVGSLKTYGNSEQISRGRLIYGTAKADFDSVIAGLTIALSEGEDPEDLPSLEMKLYRGASNLAELCKSANDLVPSDTGRKGVLGGLVQGAIEPIIRALSEGVSALYNNRRNDNQMIRQTIRTQLEAVRWPDFGEVKPAQ